MKKRAVINMVLFLYIDLLKVTEHYTKIFTIDCLERLEIKCIRRD